MARIGRISFRDSGPIGKLRDLFADFAGNIDAALTVKFVATLSALNGIGLTEDTPAGTLATLSANDSGLAAGATFILTPDGKWKLMGSTTALNVDTFVSALASYPNVRVLRGSQLYDVATLGLKVFTSEAGAYASLAGTKTLHGSGTITGAIAVGATASAAIAFPASSFAAMPSNIIVTTESTRLTAAAVTRTKDGFTVQLTNWSNGSQAAGAKYYWTAIA